LAEKEKTPDIGRNGNRSDSVVATAATAATF